MVQTTECEFLAGVNTKTLARFATLFFENSYDSVVITTGSPDDHKILYVNHAFTKMTGYDASEAIGRKPSFLGGLKTNLETIGRLKSCLLDGQPYEGATTNYRKDGTPYFVKWNIQPVYGDSGEIEYFIAIQQDLSKLKNSLNRLKSTSSHFKAFLGDISRQSELLTQESDALVESAKREFSSELDKNQSVFEEIKEDETSDIFDDELFGDDDLFGFDDDEEETVKADTISAVEYLSENEMGAADVNGLLSVIHDLETNADAIMISSNKSDEFKAITYDFQEMANAIFYMEEFLNMTLSLSELAVVMTEIEVDDVDDFVLEIIKAVISDIKAWLTAVFVDKTADDIHFLDSSIITSSKQIMQFIRTSSST